MSTDQQWAGNAGGGAGARGMQHEQMHERRIPVHDRFVPFLAPFAMTMLVVPALETITWVLGRWVVPAYLGILTIGWVTTGFLAALVALAIGRGVTRRVPIVYQHVALTAVAWGMASAVTTAYGWPPLWAIFHGFGSLIFGVSWVLYRIDSLRAAAAQNSGRDFWGEVIGLRTSRPRQVRTTDAQVEIEVAHGPGETRREIVGAAEKLTSAMDGIAGRTTVTDTDSGRAGSSLIRISLADVFADWRNFPGPSHPGMSFAYPLRTGYYETGEPEWFSFATSLRSPQTEFRSEMDTFLGAAGTTGAGKSGGINNMAAEALTRCDVIVCWIDRAKIEQNAGWCLDMLGMAGNNKSAMHLTNALRKLAEYRVKVFGQVSLDAVMDPDAADDEVGRKWTPQLAMETGEAAVLCIVDEADTAIHGAAWEWLSARGRSLGIFLYAATPRASAAEVPAVVRGSIGAWKTYAIGDNYSDGFTLSSETQDAGADPKKLRAPGLHYLDRAPGVDTRKAATLAREYRSSTKQLRAWVLRYRGATFQPMQFTAGAVAAMGAEYAQCVPARLLPGWTPPTVEPGDELPADDNMTAADRAGSADDEEDNGQEDDMHATAQGVDEEAGEAHPLDQRQFYDPDQLAQLAKIDPEVASELTQDREIVLPRGGDKPAWSTEETEQELDRVLVTFARVGTREFGNQDVRDAMRCYFDPATCSRRLHALTTGARTAPGGLAVERLGRGRFALIGELDQSINPPRPH